VCVLLRYPFVVPAGGTVCLGWERRLNIRLRAFLSFALTAGLAVAALLLWHHWSFQSGFLHYVNEAETARLDALREDIEQLYASERGWGFVDTHQRWLAHVFMRAGAPGPHPSHERRGPRRELTRYKSHGFGLTDRLALRDAADQLLAGTPRRSPHSARADIRYDGQVVGFLELAPVETLSAAADLQFASQQRDALYVAALTVLVAAAIAAALFARGLSVPIRALAGGTHALASGRYETRIRLDRRDELGRLAEDFNALAQALERNRDARRQWVADISHELRTPIAILRAELEALEDGVRPTDASAVRSLAAEVARLGALVDDLYELARSDAGALSYAKRPVDLREVLADVVASFRDRFGAARLALEQQASGPATVFGDPDRLWQLFANLLENSLRYTDAGGVVRAGMHVAESRVRVTVEDSAPGVPDDALPRLFDRLYRVDASRSRETGAAGLGLAICASIVDAHGGTIVARHSSLGGVAIDVELPLHGAA
jgi:two-component system, OmpR family, sensor histidine kinase BaeS